MARPNKKGPSTTVDIRCARCRAPLYRYRKGGKGALVKCFLLCPGCGSQFARDTLVRGTPAFKIIGGKVAVK
ncbi:hypothetical protein KUV89_17220 [Marinobacter hydrocarbonoclasticus]|nr:hypothetical protein [Marinobacter nauticus]